MPAAPPLSLDERQESSAVPQSSLFSRNGDWLGPSLPRASCPVCGSCAIRSNDTHLWCGNAPCDWSENKALSALDPLAGGALVPSPRQGRRKWASLLLDRKSVRPPRVLCGQTSEPFQWETKGEGEPCQQGETAANTHCQPAEQTESGGSRPNLHRRRQVYAFAQRALAFLQSRSNQVRLDRVEEINARLERGGYVYRVVPDAFGSWSFTHKDELDADYGPDWKVRQGTNGEWAVFGDKENEQEAATYAEELDAYEDLDDAFEDAEITNRKLAEVGNPYRIFFDRVNRSWELSHQDDLQQVEQQNREQHDRHLGRMEATAKKIAALANPAAAQAAAETANSRAAAEGNPYRLYYDSDKEAWSYIHSKDEEDHDRVMRDAKEEYQRWSEAEDVEDTLAHPEEGEDPDREAAEFNRAWEDEGYSYRLIKDEQSNKWEVRFIRGRKWLSNYLTKDAGQPCQQGEAASRTGCIPAEGDGQKKPSRKERKRRNRAEREVRKQPAGTEANPLPASAAPPEEVKQATRKMLLQKIRGGYQKSSALLNKAKAIAAKVGKKAYHALPDALKDLVDLAAWVDHQIHGPAEAIHSLAAEVAAEKGLTDKEQQRLSDITKAVDFQMSFWANIPVAHHLLHETHAVEGPTAWIAAKIGYYIPVASLAYIAGSVATNPMAVLRAARNMITGHLKGAAVSGHKSTQQGISRVVVAGIADLLVSATDPDWAEALFSVAFDKVHDPERALELTKRVLTENPTIP